MRRTKPGGACRNEKRMYAALAAAVVLGIASTTAAWRWGDEGGARADALPAPDAGLAAAFRPMPFDRTDGRADAPVVVVEWLAPTCPHCAAFHSEVVPGLLSGPIARGEARLVRRTWANNRFDFEIDAAARCLDGGERGWGLIDSVLEGAKALAAQGRAGSKEEHEARVGAMVRAKEEAAGILPSKAAECASGQVGSDFKASFDAQQAAFGLRGTPTIVVGRRTAGAPDGWRVAERLSGPPTLEAVEASIARALASGSK